MTITICCGKGVKDRAVRRQLKIVIYADVRARFFSPILKTRARSLISPITFLRRGRKSNKRNEMIVQEAIMESKISKYFSQKIAKINPNLIFSTLRLIFFTSIEWCNRTKRYESCWCALCVSTGEHSKKRRRCWENTKKKEDTRCKMYREGRFTSVSPGVLVRSCGMLVCGVPSLPFQCSNRNMTTMASYTYSIPMRILSMVEFVRACETMADDHSQNFLGDALEGEKNDEIPVTAS